MTKKCTLAMIDGSWSERVCGNSKYLAKTQGNRKLIQESLCHSVASLVSNSISQALVSTMEYHTAFLVFVVPLVVAWWQILLHTVAIMLYLAARLRKIRNSVTYSIVKMGFQCHKFKNRIISSNGYRNVSGTTRATRTWNTWCCIWPRGLNIYSVLSGVWRCAFEGLRAGVTISL